jgi:hypothetical protein
MLFKADISDRNRKLIRFISGLGLGIHIIDLPEKPRFVSSDYKYLLNGFVKNFKIILQTKEYDGDTLLECRVDANPDEQRSMFAEWLAMYEHKRIYTLTYGDLFVAGFNHHDKLNKSRPYPVFARFFPHIYYEYDRAKELQSRFPEYELEIK